MASNRRINYTVAFTADTVSAEAQVQKLRASLNSLTNLAKQSENNSFGLTNDLQQATQSAAQLRAQLQGAINVNTGQLDLSKFSQSLTQSGMSLKKYQIELNKLGPEGQKAFAQLAESITMSEVPLRRSNALLNDFAVTMKNAAKWQISSSILHGLMGSMQSAYGYAQDLNESLNNIRIVTGKSSDEMVRFAKEANKAAKQLSATTTDYTDASLIYYQQGLSGEAVKERTDVTIKMAKVARESAEKVSDQMTAVWNNFYDGSKPLEYYADVMVKLGAATASSTDEIADGLEKFAAISNTVGLSYDYAATALATVTAETRQSADVVGTAYKTLFARIQGLELGETLDDGTTLNKYSEALMKVGINIKDSNGELKKMDNILDEMGEKWTTLSEDEQVALAQKVAGVRQYSQLIALMENWDKFQENLGIAKNSEGALQEQADIYSESWEAARDRVTASLEDIYQKLLKDDAFIGLLNMVDKLLSGFSKMIDSVGGLKGVLLGLGAVVTKVFSTQISNGLRDMATNLAMSTKSGREKIQNLRKEANNALIDQAFSSNTREGKLKAESYKAQGREQLAYIENVEKMNDLEKSQYQILMDGTKQLRQATEEQEKQLAAEEKSLNNLVKRNGLQQELNQKIVDENGNETNTSYLTSFRQNGAFQQIYDNPFNFNDLTDTSTIDTTKLESLKEYLNNIKVGYEEINMTFQDAFGEEAAEKLETLRSLLSGSEIDIDKVREALKGINQVQSKMEGDQGNRTKELIKKRTAELKAQHEQEYEDLEDQMKRQFDPAVYTGNMENRRKDARDWLDRQRAELDSKYETQAKTEVEKIIEQTNSTGAEQSKFAETLGNSSNASDKLVKNLESLRNKQMGVAEGFTTLANGAMSFSMGLSALSSAWDTIQNPDLSGWEKFTSIAMSLSMGLPALLSGLKSITTAAKALGTSMSAESVLSAMNTAATKANTAAKNENADSTQRQSSSSKEFAKQKFKEATAQAKDSLSRTKNNIKGFFKGDSMSFVKQANGTFKNGDKIYQADELAKMGITKKSSAALGSAKAGETVAVGFKSGLAAAGPFLAALAAIAVAIGAITIATKIYNKEQTQADEAKKNAQAMAETYETVKDKYDQMKNTISSYEDAVTGIKKLTEGTTEFKEAVSQANQEALELIENYEGLKYSTDENGLINIDKKSLEEVQKQQFEQVVNAQNASLYANQIAKQAQAKADQIQLARDMDTKESMLSGDRFTGTGGGAAAGAALGGLIGSFAGPVGTIIGSIAGVAIGAATGGAITEFAGVASDKEMKALDEIAKLRAEMGDALFSNESKFKELLEGKGIDSKLADSLWENREAVQEQTKATNEATEAIKQYRNTAVKNKYSEEIKDTGLNTKQQEFLSSVLGGSVFETTKQSKSSKYWNERKYQDHFTYQSDYEWFQRGVDKDLIEAFKKAFPEYITSKGGTFSNEVDFYSENGGEPLTLNREAIIDRLAEKEALDALGDNDTINTWADKIRQLSAKDAELINQVENTTIKGFQTYKNDLKKFAMEELKFSEEEAEDYIVNYGKNIKGSAKYRINRNLDLNFPEGRKDSNDAFIEKLGEQLDEDQLQIAVDVSADAQSLDDFTRKLENALNEATYTAITGAIESVENVLEDGDLTPEELTTLENEEKFKEYLEAQSMSLIEFTTSTYTEQYAIVNDYYTKLRILQGEVMETQEANYLNQIAQIQALIDYKQAEKTNDEDTKNALKDAYGGVIDFEVDLDTSELEKQLSELQGKFDEIKNQEIKINVSWDDYDALEGSFKKLGSFAKTLQDESELVGNSYQLTAEQAKEWIRVYPDLFKEASVTNDGIVQINKQVADDYIKDQENQVDASIQAEIDKLKVQRESLVTQKELHEAELEMAKNGAMGKSQLEGASAEYVMKLRSSLVKYYQEHNQDEVTANKNALDLMGLNQLEYTKMVGDAAGASSTAMMTATNEIAQTWMNTYNSLGDSLPAFFQSVSDATNAAMAGTYTPAAYPIKRVTVNSSGGTSSVSGDSTASTVTWVGDNLNSGEDLKNQGSNSSGKADKEEAKKQAIDDLTKYYEDLIASDQYQIDVIDAKILGYEALKNQDAKDYGEKDADKVKNNNKDKEKKLEDEKERYHEINEELEDLERHLSKIEKQTDRAFGRQKLELYDRQIDDINKQIDLTKSKLAEAEAYRLSDQARLNYYGATYDSAGRVNNYDELMAKEVAAYNAAVDTGNESAIKAAEKRWEDFKKVLDNYEDSLNQVEEAEDTIQDLVYSVADAKLAKIEYEVEVNVELNEASLKRLEYQLKKIEDKSFNQAQSIVLMQEQVQGYKQEVDYNLSGIEKILGDKGLSKKQIRQVQAGDFSSLEGKDMTAAEIESIQKMVNAALEGNEKMMELNRTIQNELVESYQEWNEEIDKNLAKFDYYKTVISHYNNIVDLMGKRSKIQSETEKAMKLADVANEKNRVKALQDTLAAEQANEIEAKEHLNDAKTEEDKKYWQNQIDMINDRQAEIQDQILSSTEEMMQNVTQIYNDYLKNILDDFEKEVAGSFGSLEKLQDAYDKKKTKNDEYLKDYKKLYELDKLSRQLNKALDDNPSIKTKTSLRKLQEDINKAQQNGVKLSEYDLEVLQKRYNLKMAEAALDDARNAKTQVRLVRNNEGSFGYIYTANDENVDSAVQDYEDKLFDLQDLNEKYIEEMGAAFVETQKKMVDELSKIQLEDFESLTEYKKAVDEVSKYYQDRLNYYGSEMQKGLDNNKILYREEYLTFKENNERKNLSYENFTTSFTQTTIGQLLPAMKSIQDYQELINIAMFGGGDGSEISSDSLLGKMNSAYGFWENQIKEVLELVGITDMDSLVNNVMARLYGDESSVKSALGLTKEEFELFKDEVDGVLTDGKGSFIGVVDTARSAVWKSMYNDKDSIAKGSDKAKTAVSNLANKAKTSFKSLSSSVASWQKEWSNNFTKAINKTEKLTASYQKLIKTMSQKLPKVEIETPVVKNSDTTPPNDNNNDNDNDTEKNPDSKKKEKKEKKTKKKEKKTWVYANNKALFNNILTDYTDPENKRTFWAGRENIKEAGYYIVGKPFTEGNVQYIKIKNGAVTRIVRYDFLEKYDTGGYTGAWGPDGKIAMLHEKEMVLNKSDTANLLDTVSIVRNLVNNLQLPKLLDMVQPNSIQKINNSRTVQQNITISADFPAAKDRNEIELALTGLMEKASQFAFRD